ncbi:MAG: hypothetical protein JKY95_20300 [Planctomycetaceae bacterium]|nr:hypothetical protein [Planctomycetaceae bacterium]
MSAQLDSNVTLGQSIFGNAQLGDKRRTARLVQTFDLMRRHPGGSLPQKMASPADLRAFYRLCDTCLLHISLSNIIEKKKSFGTQFAP